MTRVGLLIGVAAAIIVAYPIVMLLLARAVHPRRMRMVDLERELMTSGQLSPLQQHFVRSMVDDAMDPWDAVHFAVAFPVFVANRLSGNLRDTKPWLPEGDAREKMLQFCGLHMWSVAAANLISFAIIIIEMAIYGLCAMPVALMLGSPKLNGPWEFTAFTAARSNPAC